MFSRMLQRCFVDNWTFHLHDGGCKMIWMTDATNTHKAKRHRNITLPRSCYLCWAWRRIWDAPRTLQFPTATGPLWRCSQTLPRLYEASLVSLQMPKNITHVTAVWGELQNKHQSTGCCRRMLNLIKFTRIVTEILEKKNKKTRNREAVCWY